MKLTGPQIEAAMTLAGITRDALCREVGIAKKTLNDTLNGKTYRDTTINKIRGLLETRGIEFLPGEGVRKQEKTITTYEGEDSLKFLLEDIFHTLQAKGGEMLVAHLSEGDAVKTLGAEYLEEQIRKRKAAKITHRLLVQASDPRLIPPYDSYHILPDECFSSYPLYVYGHKLALRSRQPEKVIIIDDQRFAEAVRKLFDFAWARTKQPDQ